MTPVQTWHFDICQCGHRRAHHHVTRCTVGADGACDEGCGEFVHAITLPMEPSFGLAINRSSREYVAEQKRIRGEVRALRIDMPRKGIQYDPWAHHPPMHDRHSQSAFGAPANSARQLLSERRDRTKGMQHSARPSRSESMAKAAEAQKAAMETMRRLILDPADHTPSQSLPERYATAREAERAERFERWRHRALEGKQNSASQSEPGRLGTVETVTFEREKALGLWDEPLEQSVQSGQHIYPGEEDPE